MKTACFSIALFVYVTLAHADVSPQNAICIKPQNGKPSTAIGAIYMGGWFPPSGAPNSSSESFDVDLEIKNRAYLQQMANQTGVTIAVPLAEPKWYGKTVERRDWGGIKLATLQDQAQSACSGLPLAKKKILIGFSSGGYAAVHLGNDCPLAKGYTTMLALGEGYDPKRGTGRVDNHGINGACGTPVISLAGESHNLFNKTTSKLVASELANVSPGPGATLTPSVAQTAPIAPAGPSTFATASSFASSPPSTPAAKAPAAVTPAPVYGRSFQLLQLDPGNSAAH